MIHAYDKSYLSAAQKNLARMLDYLVNDLHYPLETAWQWFLISKMAFRFEQGDCSVLVGLSGVELARAVLEQAGEAYAQAHQPALPVPIGSIRPMCAWLSGLFPVLLHGTTRSSCLQTAVHPSRGRAYTAAALS